MSTLVEPSVLPSASTFGSRVDKALLVEHYHRHCELAAKVEAAMNYYRIQHPDSAWGLVPSPKNYLDAAAWLEKSAETPFISNELVSHLRERAVILTFLDTAAQAWARAHRPTAISPIAAGITPEVIRCYPGDTLPDMMLMPTEWAVAWGAASAA